VLNSAITFWQDFVVPQVMEFGPTTKVCQYYHQKFWKCTSVWGFADIASVVWWFIGRFFAAMAWSVVRFLVPAMNFLKPKVYQFDFMRKFWKPETNADFCGFQNFEKLELKISSIRSIRIILKNLLIRIIRIICQRINRYFCQIIDVENPSSALDIL